MSICYLILSGKRKALMILHAPRKFRSHAAIGTVNLRSGKMPITWHRVTRHFQNIEYRPGI
ncbi:MAG: hypothetical protein AB2807_08730, partial [Candidatus Sedimenticola endophacoides]